MKTCTSCNMKKKLSEFNKKSDRKDGLQSTCKVCNRAASRKYYAKNKVKHLSNIKKNQERYRNEARKWIYQFLLENPCIDCGEDDPIVLEFDHVRGIKIKSISTLLGEAYSLKIIKKEIEKCDVRCANCHRRKTAVDFNWWIIKMGS